MAGGREAEIKVTFKRGSAKDGLKDIENEAKKTSGRIATSLKAGLKEGLSAGKDQLKGIFGDIKGLMKSALTLGGSLGLGMAIHHAMDLEQRWKNLAFAIRAGGKGTLDWRKEMERVHETAKKWKVSTDDVTTSYQALFQDLGDVDMARTGSELVAQANRATGASFGTLTNIVGGLNEKFGVTKEEMPQALAAAISLANQGGLSIDDMGERVGLLGASAKLMGLRGVEGFKAMIGMANLADGPTGNLKKTIAGVTGLFDQMSQADFGKKVKTNLGIDVKKDGQLRSGALLAIIEKSKGKKEILAKVFSGEQLKIVTDIASEYRRVYEETSGSTKEKAAEAMSALEEGLKKAGEGAITAADIEKEARSRLKDPQAQFTSALEEFTHAFTKPELSKAISDLAEHLPAFAKMLAKITETGIENPAAAAGGYMAFRVGGAMLTSGLSAAFRGGGKEAGSAVAKEMTAAGPATGQAIAKNMGTAGGAGGLGAVGTTAAIVAAVAAVIAADQGKKLAKETGMESSMLSVLPGFNKDGKFDSDKLIEGALAQVTFGLVGGTDKMTSVQMGRRAAELGGEVLSSDDRANQAAKMEKLMREEAPRTGTAVATTPADIAAMANGGVNAMDKDAKAAADALKGMATNAKDAAAAMRAVVEAGGPSAGTKGPRKAGAVVPGAAPRGG